MENQQIEIGPDIETARNFIDNFCEIFQSEGEKTIEQTNREVTEELMRKDLSVDKGEEEKSDHEKDSDFDREFTFRTFPENLDQQLYQDEGLTITGTFSKVKDTLIERNKNKKEGIYVLLNKSDFDGTERGHRIYEENVTHIRALFGDIPYINENTEDNIPPEWAEVLKPHMIVRTSGLRSHPIWISKGLPKQLAKKFQLGIGFEFRSFSVPKISNFVRLPGFYSFDLTNNEEGPDDQEVVKTKVSYEVANKVPPYRASKFVEAFPFDWFNILPASDGFLEGLAGRGYSERKKPPVKGEKSWSQNQWDYFLSYLDKVRGYSISEGSMTKRAEVSAEWNINADVLSKEKSNWKKRGCPDPWQEDGINPFD